MAKSKKQTRKIVTIIPGDATISVVARRNPYRPGSVAARTFDILHSGMTAAEFREACRRRRGDLGYLAPMVAAGRIKVRAGR